MERTYIEVTERIIELNSLIDESIEKSNALSREREKMYDELHSLKEEEFELRIDIKKGDIIQDVDGILYEYCGIARHYASPHVIVHKVCKNGKPSKQLQFVYLGKFSEKNIKPPKN